MAHYFIWFNQSVWQLSDLLQVAIKKKLFLNLHRSVYPSKSPLPEGETLKKNLYCSLSL